MSGQYNSFQVKNSEVRVIFHLFFHSPFDLVSSTSNEMSTSEIQFPVRRNRDDAATERKADKKADTVLDLRLKNTGKTLKKKKNPNTYFPSEQHRLRTAQ